MNANTRWLTVAIVVIVVLGVAYAVYKRNTSTLEDYNSITTTSPMPDTATAVPEPSSTLPPSPFEISQTTAPVTDSMPNPETPNGMAPATTQ
jgi:hypothetical protein